MINLQKNEDELANEIMGKVNLSKDKEKLGGNIVNLSKCIVNLSKKADVDIGATKAQVVAVIDYSGSMDSLYRNGTVQGVINKLLPFGLTFDDNGEVEVFKFSNDYEQLKSLNINNYDDYVIRNMKGHMGGTEYAPVLEEIKTQYIDGSSKKGLLVLFKHKNKTLTGADASVNPVFVIFITDGDNCDKSRTDNIIRELSHTNCFIQFIGVGNAAMDYLEKLDDLTGRDCDNTGFTRFADIASVSDSQLYEAILGDYAKWLKVKGF